MRPANPNPLSLSFDVTNGAPVIVFAEIQVDGLNGVADLGDPPTLSLNLPKGASVTTASGVFDSFVTATVPEPSTWAMMLLGFAGLGYAAYRRTRNAVSVGRIPTPLKRAKPTGQITRYLNRTYRVLATRTGTRGRGALPAPARHANRPRTLRRDLKRLAVGPREVAEVDRAALEMRSTCKRTGVRIPPSPPLPLDRSITYGRFSLLVHKSDHKSSLDMSGRGRTNPLRITARAWNAVGASADRSARGRQIGARQGHRGPAPL